MAYAQKMSDVDLWCRYELCDDVITASKTRFEKWIGAGMSSRVALVHSVEKKDEKKAMKVMSVSMRKKNKGMERLMDAMFLREMSILQHVNHRHILSNVNAYVSSEFRVMITPFCSGGNLLSLLPGLTNETTKKYFLQVSNAVFYLNKRRIVHRDIKPDNILFNSAGDAILADFGLAFVLNKELHDRESGSLAYMPPEVFTHKPLDRYKSDSFALGVTLWNMVFKTADVPYPQCPHCVVEMCPSHFGNPLFGFIIHKLCHHDMHARWSVECMVANRKTLPDLDLMLSQMDWQ